MGRIIFGAGKVGQVLLNQCILNGIDVLGFCDEDKSRGALSVEQAKRRKVGFLIATGDVKNVRSKLAGYDIFHNETVKLLKQVHLSSHDIYTQWCILNCIDANENYNNELFLRSLDIIITEKCTLRCKDCSNLMQYYKSPENLDIEQVYEDVLKVLQTHTVGEFRVIGGEVFAHPKWAYLVDRLVKDDRVKRIVLYTNGTIVPDHSILLNNKVLVFITDYGCLSGSIKKIKYFFDCHNIQHIIVKPEWTDCGSIKKHYRTKKALKKIYNACCSHNVTLSNGKLYGCAFSANLSRLGIYDSFASCDFCNGRPYNAEKIVPAEQKAK